MKHLRFTFYLSVALIFFLTISSKAQQPDSTEQKIKKAINKSINNGVRPSKLRDVKLAASSIFITLDSQASVENVIVSESLISVFEARDKITSLLKTHINNLALDKGSYSNTYIIVIIMIGSLKETTIQLARLPENWEDLFKGIDISLLNGKTLKYYYPAKMETFSIK